MSNIIISAGRFLDLLQCVIPVTDDKRPSLATIQLNILAEKQALQTVATNGTTLSIAQRSLGFATDKQANLLDLMNDKIEHNITWLIQKIDCELLILALKKFGIKRGKDNENSLIYIEIKETKTIETQENNEKLEITKLKISVLGDCSLVALEPIILTDKEHNITFPEWKSVLSEKNEETNYLGLDAEVISTIKSCWGNEKVLITFCGANSPCKITRFLPTEENENDLIILMPVVINEDVKQEKIANQLTIIQEHKEIKPNDNKNEELNNNPKLFNNEELNNNSKFNDILKKTSESFFNQIKQDGNIESITIQNSKGEKIFHTM